MKTTGAALALLLLASTSALAQTYSGRIVTFGDSLSDNGNLFRLTGQPPSPPYFAGRFSNGPVWVENLTPFQSGFFTPLPLGSTNYAFGFARTDVLSPLNSSPTAPGSSFFTGFDVVTAPPGIPVQAQSYLARGGRFAPGDVVTILGGANNFFQLLDARPGQANDPTRAGFVPPGAASVGATAVTAAGDIGRSVATLVAAGAQTFVIPNLPDLGATPNFNGSPVTAAAGSGATLAFNTALAQTLQAASFALPGADIISVDLQSVFQEVRLNPTAFGFLNTRDACLSTPSCLFGGAAVQNTYLFWDGVHPTAAGHRLISDTVREHLRSPQTVAELGTLADLAVDDRRLNALRALDRLDAAGPVNPLLPTGGEIGVVGSSVQVDGDGARPSYRSSSAGLGFGLTRSIGEGLALALQGSATTGEARVGAYRLDPTAFNLDAGLGYSSGLVFAKAAFGVGLVDFDDVERRTLGPLFNTSQGEATTGSAAVEAGLRTRLGAVELSPRARLAWFGAQLDGLTETGLIAPVALTGRDVSLLTGAVEIRASVDLVRDAARFVQAHATLGYEGSLSSSGDTAQGRLINNTARARIVDLDTPRDPGVTLGAGLTASLGGQWAVAIDYRGSFAEESQRHQGMLSASYRF